MLEQAEELLATQEVKMLQNRLEKKTFTKKCHLKKKVLSNNA
jgi:hypothetical protein